MCNDVRSVVLLPPLSHISGFLSKKSSKTLRLRIEGTRNVFNDQHENVEKDNCLVSCTFIRSRNLRKNHFKFNSPSHTLRPNEIFPSRLRHVCLCSESVLVRSGVTRNVCEHVERYRNTPPAGHCSMMLTRTTTMTIMTCAFGCYTRFVCLFDNCVVPERKKKCKNDRNRLRISGRAS